MKLKLPRLTRCAFAAVLLSVSQFALQADEFEETAQAPAQEELIAAADESVFADTLFDIGADNLLLDQDIDSNLVAKAKKPKKKKHRNKANEEIPDFDLAKVDNTWTPRFVWLGDVENSDNLKCFAAFLIGSLDGKEGGSNFDPGVVMTPINNESTANSDLSPSNMGRMTAQRGKRSRHRGPGPKPGKSRMSLEFDAGPAYMAFYQYRGNLVPEPRGLFPATGALGSSFPVKGRPIYTVSPLFEMSAIFNIVRWIGFGFYAQACNNVFIQTKPWQSLLNAPTLVHTGVGHLESSVDFYAIGGKLMFNFYNLIRFKTWAMGLYAGGGAGVSYQIWKGTKTYTTYEVNTLGLTGTGNTIISYNPRYMANFSYTGDAGISFKSRNPFSKTLLKFGCKFVGWGITKGLGEAQSTTDVRGIWKPVKFTGIYTVAPYMGFNWSF